MMTTTTARRRTIRTSRPHPRTQHRAALTAALGYVLAATLAACAAPPPAPTQPARVSSGEVSAEQVVSASPLASLGSAINVSDVNMLEMSPAMHAFLDEYVDRDANQSERIAQLLKAVLGGDRFALAYDDSTRTAASTFENGRGNCLSFTNMFIAMAREIGLEASYQEVEIPPDWTISGQTFLISEHVNVLVEVRNALGRVVDFNSYDTVVDVETESRVITDARARAHYFNNIGVERMLAGDTGLAYANFQQSVREDHNFASTWVNLGILHRREGYPNYAEAAYKEALRHDGDNLMAMSNLAHLYEDQGRSAEAERYLARVREHRMGNPFYRFRLANIAFEEGDYKSAIKNLKTAVRQKDDEDRFYYLLSLSYLMAGDRDEAQKWMEQAEEVAKKTDDQKRYSRKLELLMGKN